MGRAIDRRIHPRNAVASPISYEYHNTNYNYGANMGNYGRGGMYFESTFPLKPGTDINIRLDSSSPHYTGNEILDEYTAEVKWCREIFNADKFYFGVGVKYWESPIQ